MKKNSAFTLVELLVFLALFGLLVVLVVPLFTGCDQVKLNSSRRDDVSRTLNVSSKLVSSQPTPTDITVSLERHNLIRRAYWVNGQREKAMSMPCPVPI